MKKTIFLPVVVCSLAITLSSCSKNEAATSNKNPSSFNSTAYALYSVKEQAVGNVLRLPAQLSAYEYVNIYPKVTGYIKKIMVDIGSQVKEGQIIMEMEAPEVEQNSIAAYERYLKALSSFNSSKDSYYRLLDAAKTSGAVSPNDLQIAQAKMQSDSALCNSEKANWEAMKSLKDYLIVTGAVRWNDHSAQYSSRRISHHGQQDGWDADAGIAADDQIAFAGKSARNLCDATGSQSKYFIYA